MPRAHSIQGAQWVQYSEQDETVSLVAQYSVTIGSKSHEL
jgi:hypothetical protein